MKSAPKVSKVKRARDGAGQMNGRPVTTEEFERMLAATEKVVGPGRAGAWQHYLTGLWLSGLRLKESLDLRWDWSTSHIHVDLSSARPMLQIPGSTQKSARDQTYPVTPDFAEFLLRTPEEMRHGYVFAPSPANGSRRLEQLTLICDSVSTVCENGFDVVQGDLRQYLLGSLDDFSKASRSNSAKQLLDLREDVFDRV